MQFMDMFRICSEENCCSPFRFLSTLQLRFIRLFNGESIIPPLAVATTPKSPAVLVRFSPGAQPTYIIDRPYQPSRQIQRVAVGLQADLLETEMSEESSAK